VVIELTDIALVLALCAGAYWWWRAYAVKESVLQIVRRHCKAMDVQLLDDTVALRGMWLKRDAHGSLRVRRSYVFEFTSTGDERYHGDAVMLGLYLETIQLEPHRLN
jgi:hypothetical protein